MTVRSDSPFKPSTGMRRRMSRAEQYVAIGFALVLAGLLVGYMFLGRGFAHIGVGPAYVGDAVLVLGLAAASVVLLRKGLPRPVPWTIALLAAFMLLGVVRTVPYLGVYGLDALRDGVLWGYAFFAAVIFAVFGRALVERSFRGYGLIVPLFALWLPIAWTIFSSLAVQIDPSRPGEVVPLVFVKAGDMAVHVVGAIGFLVLGAAAVASRATFVWRTFIFMPLAWTIFVAGTANRGALLTAAVGLLLIAVLAPRTPNWLPFLTAIAVGALATFTLGALEWALPSQAGDAPPSPSAAKPSTLPRASSTELAIENPGFELGRIDSGVIDGWIAGRGEVNVLEGDAYRGRHHASLSNPLNAHQATLRSTPFAVAGGEDVAIEARIKALDGQPSIEIYLNLYDDAGTELASAFVGARQTEGSDAWRTARGVLTLPPEAVEAQILFYEASGQATLGIDAVNVRAGELLPDSTDEPSFLANPGFEFGRIESGVIDGWVPGRGNVDVVEGGAYRGTSFATLANPLAAYQATLSSSRFPVASGRDIAVAARIKAVDGDPSVVMYVDWYDGSGNTLFSAFAGALDTDGSSIWRPARGVTSVPPDATAAEIVLYEATGDATIGIDEVSVQFGDLLPENFVTGPTGRQATWQQIVENVTSIFSSSDDPGLEGTRQARLAWWSTIVDYTVFGEHFWTGKGFGINLADSDGFQSTADGSLRAPHNSHLTVLARMGVPGFVLWVALQATFVIGLVRAMLAHRRGGRALLAAVSAWILVYWTAMMVDTSFDPYLEGPQGGIWFWTVFGIGLVVTRLAERTSET